LACIAALALGACSRHASAPARVAAKVNDTEISVPRFQMFLARFGLQLGGNVKPATVLDGLIDRELLAQRALALKLDQELSVASALADAKDEILAQAYVENLIGISPEDESAVTAFYRDNPTLFEQRRVYRVFELAASVPQARIAELKQRAARAHGLYEIAAWLKAQNLPYNAGGVTKGSEQIAPQLLARLATMHEGQIQVMEVPGGASVVQLLDAQPAPLTREAAAPMIEQLLRARRRAEIAQREQKHLRSKATIEYMVDLGQPRASAPAKPPLLADTLAPFVF